MNLGPSGYEPDKLWKCPTCMVIKPDVRARPVTALPACVEPEAALSVDGPDSSLKRGASTP